MKINGSTSNHIKSLATQENFESTIKEKPTQVETMSAGVGNAKDTFEPNQTVRSSALSRLLNENRPVQMEDQKTQQEANSPTDKPSNPDDELQSYVGIGLTNAETLGLSWLLRKKAEHPDPPQPSDSQSKNRLTPEQFGIDEQGEILFRKDH